MARQVSQALWGNLPPVVHVLRNLNPERSPFDCQVHAHSLLRRVKASNPTLPAIEVEDTEVSKQERTVPITWKRAPLAGENTAHQVLPESINPENLRKAWAEVTKDGTLLSDDQLRLLKADKMVGLIQAQFPHLDYLSAAELWAKVSNSLSQKEKPDPQSQLYSNLTQNITRRDPDATPGDDLTLDLAQILARVEDHWIVKTHEALAASLGDSGGLDHAKLQRILVKLWELPEHEVRYVVDPYPLYHHLLKDLIDQPPTAPAAAAAAVTDRPAAPAEDAAEALAARQRGIAICAGARKCAKAAVRLTPSLSARDTWVDDFRGLSPLDLLYNPAVAALPKVPEGQRQGGVFTVNGKPAVDYFREARHVEELLLPFDHAQLDYRQWCVEAKTYGGNLGSQAESIRLALARAIVQLLPETAAGLSREHLLREDPRVVLPKLSGLKKHKKRRQWRKR
eukprot:EG_transcript_10634